MRYTVIIFMVIWLSGCDDPPQDPFVGTWKFTNNNLNATLEISRSGDNYKTEDISVNDEPWSRFEFREVVKAKEIGMLILSKNASSTEGIVFFSCSPFGDVIKMDSVWVLSGVPQKKIVYKDELLIKQ